jgi:hypothetical protein
MVQAPQRTAVSGPTLVRLLARLTTADVPASSQSLSDQLSQWLGWTDAIALSTALNSAPPAVASGARGAGSVEHECARVRASLADAIAGDSMLAPRRRRSAAHAQNAQQPEAEANYADFRQCYLALQQSMETRIGSLRGRLRNMVAAQTSEMTRLAVVDAIMERSLGARERSLFGAVPGLLSGHFERPGRCGHHGHWDRESSRTPARRVARRVPQGHAERVACRTRYSFSTGRRAAGCPSHQLTGTTCPDIALILSLFFS